MEDHIIIHKKSSDDEGENNLSPTLKAMYAEQMLNLQVGDYFASPNTVVFKVGAVLPGENNSKIYGTTNIRQEQELRWDTSYELINAYGGKHGIIYRKITPDWHEFDKAVAGDHIKSGNGYTKILARVGDAFLLSQSADDKATELAKTLAEQLPDELVAAMSDDLEHLRSHGSENKAQRMAGEWVDINCLVMMNWHLVTDNEAAEGSDGETSEHHEIKPTNTNSDTEGDASYAE